MEIAIIGSGIVGSATGKYFAEGLKHKVIFNDINKKVVSKLRKQGFDATTSLEATIESSEVAFICVPTPNTPEYEQDLRYIIEVSKDIGKNLVNYSGYYTVVVKSTVLPGTTRNVVGKLIEKYSGKEIGKEFGLCMNPEFLTFIQNTWTSDKEMDKKPANENFIVTGEYNKKSGNVLKKVYEKTSPPKFRMSLEAAEFIKYANNCALVKNISYWNEMWESSKYLGKIGMDIDTHKLAKILSLDPRIGVYGSVHGMAYGGPCFKKDPPAFLKWAEQFADMPMLQATIDINKKMAEKYGVRE